MKKTITELQLKHMIKETVRRVLNEGKDANQLADAFVRKNPNIDKNGLIKLLMADPTASQNDRGLICGQIWRMDRQYVCQRRHQTRRCS